MSDDRYQPTRIPVLILAGGRGERLASVSGCPKPLIEVGGRPFIGYLLEAVWRAGFRWVIGLVGRRAAEFSDTLRATATRALMPFLPELRIDYMSEPHPLGTAGALQAARESVTGLALVLNGDSYCALDYAALLRWHRTRAPAAAITLTAVRMADAGDYGALEIGADDRILAFAEKGSRSAGWINAGVYLVQRRFLDEIPAGPCSLERELLPRWIAREPIPAYRTDTFFRDIGTPARLAQARGEFPPPDLAPRADHS